MLTLLLAATLGQAPTQSCPTGTCPRPVAFVQAAFSVNNPPAAPATIPQPMQRPQPVREFLRRMLGR